MAGKLASDFVTSVGGNVQRVEGFDERVVKTYVQTNSKNSYTAGYLAKIFNCDINDGLESPKAGKDKQITIVIGQDFSDRFWP